jgi:hypothetical protein
VAHLEEWWRLRPVVSSALLKELLFFKTALAVLFPFVLSPFARRKQPLTVHRFFKC